MEGRRRRADVPENESSFLKPGPLSAALAKVTAELSPNTCELANGDWAPPPAAPNEKPAKGFGLESAAGAALEVGGAGSGAFNTVGVDVKLKPPRLTEGAAEVTEGVEAGMPKEKPAAGAAAALVVDSLAAARVAPLEEAVVAAFPSPKLNVASVVAGLSPNVNPPPAAAAAEGLAAVPEASAAAAPPPPNPKENAASAPALAPKLNSGLQAMRTGSSSLSLSSLVVSSSSVSYSSSSSSPPVSSSPKRADTTVGTTASPNTALAGAGAGAEPPRRGAENVKPLVAEADAGVEAGMEETGAVAAGPDVLAAADLAAAGVHAAAGFSPELTCNR